MKLWYIVVLVMSSVGFIIMGIDKGKARKQKWRIPENTLWIIALLGGAPGMWLGMAVFRHKTKHKTFKFGLPILSLLLLGIVFYLS
ncbi:DUF1294 domain-containing protein [Piscibacillus salipiscarius]|uniref:DUF1294 domain-containing protein n=1 Tax=Piscibacillus salipiscarius TaxID=299480 RepID=A0ABW5QDM2_9BACI